MANYFPVVLDQAGHQWLLGLPQDSFDSWEELRQAFIDNFIATCEQPRNKYDLERIRDRKNEPLRDYIRRFSNSGRARRARSRLQGPETRLLHKRSPKRVQGQISANTEAHIRHSNNVEKAKALLRRPSSLGNHQFPSWGYPGLCSSPISTRSPRDFAVLRDFFHSLAISSALFLESLFAIGDAGVVAS